MEPGLDGPVLVQLRANTEGVQIRRYFTPQVVEDLVGVAVQSFGIGVGESTVYETTYPGADESSQESKTLSLAFSSLTSSSPSPNRSATYS